MTVKDLIEKLQQLPQNLSVVYSTQEDTYEPSPHVRKFDFNHNYYAGKEFKTIKANEEFVEL